MLEELIAPRPQRAAIDRDHLAAGHDVLPAQLRAVEPLRRGIEISNDEGYFFASGDLDFARLKAMIPDRQGVGRLLRMRGAGQHDE